MLLGMSGILFLASCNGDDEPTPDAPTITFEGDNLDEDNPDSFTGHPEDEVSFNVIVNAPAGFNVLRITKQGGEDFEMQEITRTQAGQTTFSHPFSYTLSAQEVGEEVVFVFTAVDDSDQTTSRTFTINTEAEPEPTVAISEVFLLNSPTADKNSKTFYATTTLTRYSKNEVDNNVEALSPLIDFGYSYGATTQAATLASIANYPGFVGYDFENWTKKNQTIFKLTELEVQDFEAIGEFDNSAISSAYETGTDTEVEGRVNVQANKIYAFKTDGEKEGGQKFGLIRVVEIVGTVGSNDGVRLEIKVIK